MSAIKKAKTSKSQLPRKIAYLISQNEEDFDCIKKATKRIKDRISKSKYSDGKPWKGDELVGWIGEVYGKLMLGGNLTREGLEYDLISGKKRVSIKTRKGQGTGWQQSGTIPRVNARVVQLI